MNTDFFAAWAAGDLRGSRRFGFPFGRRFSIRRWRRFFLYILSADETYSVRLRRFFDSPVPLLRRGVLIPLPSPRP